MDKSQSKGPGGATSSLLQVRMMERRKLLLAHGFILQEEDRSLDIDTYSRSNAAPQSGVFFRHFGALFQKRLRYAMRDKRVLIFQLLIPVAALLVGLLLLNSVSLATPPSIPLGLQQYNRACSISYSNRFLP